MPNGHAIHYISIAGFEPVSCRFVGRCATHLARVENKYKDNHKEKNKLLKMSTF